MKQRTSHANDDTDEGVGGNNGGVFSFNGFPFICTRFVHMILFYLILTLVAVAAVAAAADIYFFGFVVVVVTIRTWPFFHVYPCLIVLRVRVNCLLW